MTTKDDLHRLVDTLPDVATDEAVRWLRALSAPIDDEPLTDDDLAAIAKATQDLTHGDVTPWPELKRRRQEERNHRAGTA
jgi:hypothetical protein